MLLGCCHCGETQSESDQPSVPPESSASSETTIETLGCGICRDSVAPRFMTLNFPYSGSSGLCCSIYSAITYNLEYDSSLILDLGQVCGAWKSDVYQALVGTRPVQCNHLNSSHESFGRNRLAYFYLTQAFDGSNKRANLWIRFNNQTVHYRTALPLGALEKFDCLSAMTLPYYTITNDLVMVPCTGASWSSSVRISI